MYILQYPYPTVFLQLHAYTLSLWIAPERSPEKCLRKICQGCKAWRCLEVMMTSTTIRQSRFAWWRLPVILWNSWWISWESKESTTLRNCLIWIRNFVSLVKPLSMQQWFNDQLKFSPKTIHYITTSSHVSPMFIMNSCFRKPLQVCI